MLPGIWPLKKKNPLFLTKVNTKHEQQTRTWTCRTCRMWLHCNFFLCHPSFPGRHCPWMHLSEKAFPKIATWRLKLILGMILPSSSNVIWLRQWAVYCPLFQLPNHTRYQVHEPPELSLVPTDTLHYWKKREKRRWKTEEGKKDADQGSKRKTGEGNSTETEVLEVLRISWFS